MLASLLPWLLALDMGVAATAAPPTAVPTAAPTAAPTMTPPAAPTAAPPAATGRAACDQGLWTQPAAAASSPVAVRVQEDASFEMILTGPPKAPAPPSLTAGDKACLWIEPSGGYTYTVGLGASAPPSDTVVAPPSRPPQGRRFHQLDVRPCPAGQGTGSCLRLEGVPPLEDEPGRIPALLRLPGHELPVSLLLHRTPGRWTLAGFMFLGLLFSFILTLWAPKLAALRDHRRRLRQLVARREASKEDFMPLLNRVDALLALCRERLDGKGALLGVLVFDDVLLDDRLTEAAQLLELSEEKTAIWNASQTADLPPSVQAEIADLLRQFDTDVFLLGLPVDATKTPVWHPASLRAARERLAGGDGAFRQNLVAALRALFPGPATAPPGPEEPVAAQVAQAVQVPVAPGPAPAPAAASLPGIVTPQPEPRPAGPLPKWAEEACQAVLELRAKERERLARFRDSDLTQVARRELREIDARLNVLRAAERFLDFLGTERGRALDEKAVERLREGLREWERQDLLGPIAGRPDLPALRTLLWSHENAQAITQVRELLSRTPPRLHIVAPRQWRTYEPVSLELVLDDAQAATYVWRQNVKVVWRLEPAGDDAVQAARFAVDPRPGRTGEADDERGRLFGCRSARTTAFTADDGAFRVTVARVELSDPLKDGAGQIEVTGLAPVPVTVTKSSEARWYSGIGLANVMRLFCTGLLAFGTGLVFVDSLFANAQGGAVYAQAFAWAFGLDVATVVLRGGFRKLQELQWPWLRGVA